MPVVTVTQLNKYLGSVFRGDRNLQGIMIKGEISNFVCHYKSGHMYFTIKDSESTLKAVMFAQAAARLKFVPEDGMSIVAAGNIVVYERDGVYQINVTDIIPEGKGKETAALEQLKRKLAKEGIFETAHKRPLPDMPKKIGVVTSLSGAAVRDIINVLSRRWPLGEVYAVNAVVQGQSAPDSICAGILSAESAGCDVVIVGRGGGSSEDLSSFNSEKVAYAVYNCKVPVISAVGHETDVSITDLAADMRAPTPSAAAELAASVSVDILSDRIRIAEKRLKSAVSSVVSEKEEKTAFAGSRLAARSPENLLRLTEERLENLRKRYGFAFASYLGRMESKVNEKIRSLDNLSPLKVLSRGYSLVYKGEELISDSDKLENGDIVSIRLGEGGVTAEIKDKW
ncbi:MAG: exodeoxyribonuclease VII large subunit [Ruminococcus sp.]|nr:exodeoxyribonuclease VII large subunit [Ruminococcus sp.]